MNEEWETQIDQEATDWQEGHDAMTLMLMEDEAWAVSHYEAFHGQEY